METLYSTIYYSKYFIELNIDSLHNMLPFELTKDTPYLALSGELWSVFYEYFNRNWSCYKGFLLYWNLSIEWWSCMNRFIEIYEWNHWEPYLWRSIFELWRSHPARKCQTLGRYGYFWASENILCHYSDVTWTTWHLRSPTIWVLVQQFVWSNIIETSKFV